MSYGFECEFFSHGSVNPSFRSSNASSNFFQAFSCVDILWEIGDELAKHVSDNIIFKMN